MKTKLLELTTQKELVEEVIQTTYDKLIHTVETTINNLIADRHNAILLRKWLRESDSKLNICFELGFYNPEEEGVDFGSDIYFCYNEEDGLDVNYGTIGHYNKNAIYQVRRVKLLADIFNQIEEIENSFFNIVTSSVAEEYQKLEHESFLYDIEIRNITNAIRIAEIAEVEKSLSEGTILKYDSNIDHWERLFDTNNHGWVVYKIREKTIKMKSYDGVIKQFPKETILTLIHDKKLIKEDV